MSMLTMMVMVALLLTAISFFEGIVSMAHGGEADQRRSHWLMFRRVGFQALAVLFLLLGLLSQLA
jgi:hypothetical protein